MHRNTWMEIRLDEVEENIARIKTICNKKLIAVVKADGYGCGDIQIAQAAKNAGAHMLAVSSADEALMLRKKGYDGELLILGHTDAQDLASMIEENITVPAYSLHWLNEALNHGVKGLKVHLKIDTGMGRIGFRTEAEIRQALTQLQNADAKVTGIFTHFATSDTDREKTMEQYRRFEAVLKDLAFPFEWIHCDNSEATLWKQEDVTNACRIGIAMYGISGTVTDLKHPVSLYSRVFMIKETEPGTEIGYGATYASKEKEWIGTMPIGYADGFVRRNQGRTVFINGTNAEVVGRVCMDQTMIRVPKGTREDSVAEIFGRHIPIEKMAEELDTIPYEILCLISDRVTRIYTRNGMPVAESNARMNEAQWEEETV